jgi:hypothetical protein
MYKSTLWKVLSPGAKKQIYLWGLRSAPTFGAWRILIACGRT